MAVNYQNKIVTDQLDIAVDVSSPRCYPLTGSTVTALINGNDETDANLSFVGDPLYISNDGTGGQLIFDQSNDWATTSFTFSAWGNRDDLDEDREGRMCDVLAAGNGHLRMSLLSAPTFESRPAGGSSTTILTSSTSISAGSWYNLVVTKEGTTSGGSADYVMYLNGVQVAAATSSVLVTQALFNKYYLMRSADDDQPTVSWLGKFGPFHAYTKALSAAEVTQNFNAIRGRFGI